MADRKKIDVVLNRVEGDLKLRVEIDNGVVVDAYSSGTMFRGFEKMLVGRSALDSLVITPRICGICSSAHLNAAAQALEMVAGIIPPANAILVRNLTMTAEHLQSDIRHAFLMFMADFTSPRYRTASFFAEAVRRYQPFKGEAVQETVCETKKIPEIIAILGGQWPHSAHVVPGGITSLPSRSDVLQCKAILADYKQWYEDRVLGCALTEFAQIQSGSDLNTWLEEEAGHYNSNLGFYLRAAREAGLDRMGRGVDSFVSFGALIEPSGGEGRSALFPAGFMHNGAVHDFDQSHIAEDVSFSYFNDYEGGRHPFDGETVPLEKKPGNQKYSWCKAVRYNGLPAETGPLAELLISGHPLITDIYQKEGTHAMLRQLARLLRPALLFPAAEKWLNGISFSAPFYDPRGSIEHGQGYGIMHGSRGALGHWVKIADSRITHYQIITPTAWNASPRDGKGIRGPWEEALIGTEIKDPDDPVELGHIVRSFDACLVCSVHTLRHSAASLPEKTFLY